DGDVIYALDGVQQTSTTAFSSAMFLRRTAGPTPIAILAYPGATVTASVTASNAYGLRASGLVTPPSSDNWVVGGIIFVADQSALAGTDNIRLVGNDMSCPNGNIGGGGACPDTAASTGSKLLGNKFHHVSTSLDPTTITKLYHAVYLGTDSNHLEFAWNEIG